MGLTSPITGKPLVQDGHALCSVGERWPVVEGIPFLRTDRPHLVNSVLTALDEGDAETALVLLLGDQDNWAKTPPPSETSRRRLVHDRDNLSFRDAMDLLAFGPVGTYFAHRWSDPTFVSGLALAEAHWHNPGRVLELACGAGHFLREFARFTPMVTGGDLVFAKLWLARNYVAQDVTLVCFDAAAPWPFARASADLVFCHDAFYFLPDKPHVANEMLRVGDGGRVLVGHTHNAAVDNLSAGAPLRPDEYAALFGRSLLYDDQELTLAAVEARAPHPSCISSLKDVPALALACGLAASDIPRRVSAGLTMPRRGASLRRNPIYTDDRVVWPSDRYEREYGPLVTYPQSVEAPARAIAGTQSVDDMARRRVMLDLPERW